VNSRIQLVQNCALDMTMKCREISICWVSNVYVKRKGLFVEALIILSKVAVRLISIYQYSFTSLFYIL
jgi:hypothetical protein